MTRKNTYENQFQGLFDVCADQLDAIATELEESTVSKPNAAHQLRGIANDFREPIEEQHDRATKHSEADDG